MNITQKICWKTNCENIVRRCEMHKKGNVVMDKVRLCGKCRVQKCDLMPYCYDGYRYFTLNGIQLFDSIYDSSDSPPRLEFPLKNAHLKNRKN